MGVGGTFLKGDLLKFGCEVDPACPRCGEGIDSVFHRCFSCPMVEHEAKGRMDSLQVGVYPPAPPWKLLPLLIVVSNSSACGLTTSFVLRGGGVFVDGSCFNPAVAELARAGFGVCQADAAGKVAKRCVGAGPSPNPAKLAGWRGCCVLCSGPVVPRLQFSHRLFRDCKGLEIRSYAGSFQLILCVLLQTIVL